MIATCPSSDRLHAFVLGHLQDQESDELYGHLAGCDSCQHQLEESGSFSDTFVGQLKSDSAEENHAAEPALLQATDRAKNILSLLNRPATEAAVDATADDPAEPVPHTIGEYEIQHLIGRGGMGTVYLARHTKLGRQVALKILSRHRLADPKMQGRFSSEMKAVGRMNHPNIVAAHDAREIDGVAVLVTEYIDGLNVGSIIRRTGPLSIANATRIASEVATALAAIDTAGLIHRDIKPSNIMVSRGGAVKLLDLGLARLQTADGEFHEQREHTATGQALGTVDYIAPEQVNDGRNVDVRADIYAMGCTLFKMLTGQPVFDDAQYPTAFAKMTAHVHTAPPSVADFAENTPAPLVALVAEMLEKDPALRPQTPATLIERVSPFTGAADLAALVVQASNTEEKPLAPRSQTALAPTPVRSTGSSRRFPRTPLLIATALGGLFLGWAISWMLGIEITIKHPDGTTTKLNVANGSTVTIDENGNATVVLPTQASANGGHQGQNENSLGEPAVSNFRKFNGRDLSASLNAPPSPIEGVWKVIAPTELAGSYFVFARSHFAVVRDQTDPGQLEETAGWSGTYGIRNTSSYPQLDFTPDEPGGILNNTAIWKISSDGILQIGQTPLPTKGYPWSFEGEPGFPVELFRARKVEFGQSNPTKQGYETLLSAHLVFQQFNHSIFPDDAEFTSPPKPLPRVTEESIQGVWKFEIPCQFPHGYFVLANGVSITFGIDDKSHDENNYEKNEARYYLNTATEPVQIDFIVGDGSDEVRDLAICRFSPDGVLELRDSGSRSDVRPVSFEFKPDDSRSLAYLTRVDWSAITAPEQLPDKISRDAWQTWKELSAGESTEPDQPSIPELTLEAVEGIWQAYSQDSRPQGILVLKKSYYAAFLQADGVGNDGNILDYFGNADISADTKTLSLNGLAIFQSSGVSAAACFRRNQYGDLGRLNIQITNPASFVEPPDQGIPGVQWSCLKRLDWSAITAADQLPDEISRDAWLAWKELSPENAVSQINERSIEGIWKITSFEDPSWGYMVFRNGRHLVISNVEHETQSGNSSEMFGEYTIDKQSDEVLVNFHPRGSTQKVNATAICRFTSSGELQLLPKGDDSRTLVIDDGKGGFIKLFRVDMKRMEWADSTEPDQLPDEGARFVWKKWKEMVAESATKTGV